MLVHPVPPKDFLDRLEKFDRNLQLNFDPVQGVWHIWHKEATGELSHVTSVVEDDGSYRPLDERVFLVLERNRYYAEHPKELERLVVDSVVEERARQEKFAHDEMKHFSKDRSLNRRFNEAVDKAKSISWEEWTKPQQFSNGRTYIPTKDMSARPSKPTI